MAPPTGQLSWVRLLTQKGQDKGRPRATHTDTLASSTKFQVVDITQAERGPAPLQHQGQFPGLREAGGLRGPWYPTFLGYIPLPFLSYCSFQPLFFCNNFKGPGAISKLFWVQGQASPSPSSGTFPWKGSLGTLACGVPGLVWV